MAVDPGRPVMVPPPQPSLPYAGNLATTGSAGAPLLAGAGAAAAVIGGGQVFAVRRRSASKSA
ncbi:hypothetical protein ABZ281_33130 [Streptomyces sp. NPDC006265]|uniref:hypothetical protein n=1 Tax=Streptomyces sp. NPDC006265 TaxID=3156740 RepID=UPI0033B9DC28